MTKQVGEKPVPPRERRPDLMIVEGLEAVILKCLQPEPDRRVQDMAELARGLAPFASSRGALSAETIVRALSRS